MNARDRDALLQTLRQRFDGHPLRHEGLEWIAIEERLKQQPRALQVLARMESTGGEPDVIGQESAQYLFCDCSAESPAGRRSLCLDGKALASRKENKPRGSAMDAAVEIGIELLSVDQYARLQQLGEFDTKTSSWVATPPEVRALGGALFCDRRYGRVFTYHNGAESYYAARGFRGLLRV